MSRDDYHVEDIEVGEHTVRIYSDAEGAENPFEAWDCFATFAYRYDSQNVGKGWDELPSDCYEDDEDDENYGEYIYPRDRDGLRKFCQRKDVIAIPFDFCGNYDSIRQCGANDADGFVFATLEMIDEEYGDHSQQSCQKALSLLQAEYNTFEAWCNGEVYGYRIVLTADLEEDDDPDEIEDGACWGFYGDDYDWSGILDEAGGVIGKKIENPHKRRNLGVTRIPTAGGCATCLMYCAKMIVKAAERAAQTRQRAALVMA